MKTPRSAPAPADATWPSEHLRGAALAGLLCLATVACSAKPDPEGATNPSAAAGEQGLAGAEATATGGAGGARAEGGAQSVGGAGDAAGGASTAAAGSSDAPAAGTGGAAGAGGVAGAAGAGGSAGSGGAPPELPHITSSENVGVLTEEQFKALCDARGGTVEVMPHCGGFATAKGFSYDNATLLLSEHTCAGANTCGGWNCVLTEE